MSSPTPAATAMSYWCYSCSRFVRVWPASKSHAPTATAVSSKLSPILLRPPPALTSTVP
ncbi:hypothetical protein KSP40_PGU007947 [Platanthera guangdongensis]|uniref:Uncharacterized protein n=1 Tax=Platanthera guangdongensis TaxID=2320717 RepID=A0ABR2M085_9ASPA